ncbi:MAG: transporter [Holophaga sp.]|jgi:hypothetical protein
MSPADLARSLVLLAALPGAGALAQDGAPEAPQAARELGTVAAGAMEPGELQLNLGVQQAYARDGSSAGRVPTELDLGAWPRLTLRIQWSGLQRLRNEDGVVTGSGDPSFGALLQPVSQDQAGVDLALSWWHKMPWADAEKGLGSGQPDDTVVLAASRVSGPWEVDLNAGANWIGRQEGQGRAAQALGAAAVTLACGAGWHVSGEVLALAGTELGSRDLNSMVVVSRDLNHNLTVDVGVEAGLTRAAQRMALDAGLVWRIRGRE